MSFSQQISHDKSFHLAPKSKICQFATSQCYAERSRALNEGILVAPIKTSELFFAFQLPLLDCALDVSSNEKWPSLLNSSRPQTLKCSTVI